MLRRVRKSSARITLVLLGVAVLPACDRAADQRRDVYSSREDCLADWGRKPEECTQATDPGHRSHGFFYGPLYGYGYASRNSGSHAIASTSSHSVRGGFGASGHASGS